MGQKTLDQNALVRQINSVLESTWSSRQRAVGKWIAVDWGWMPVLKKTLAKYRDCGWDITNHVELDADGKTLWLVFIEANSNNRSESRRA